MDRGEYDALRWLARIGGEVMRSEWSRAVAMLNQERIDGLVTKGLVVGGASIVASGENGGAPRVVDHVYVLTLKGLGYARKGYDEAANMALQEGI